MAKVINHKLVSVLSNVKDTYKNCYPSDELGNDINDKLSFAQVIARMQEGWDFYETISDPCKFRIHDSVIRERIFTLIAIVAGIKYDVIYELWLNSEKIREQYLRGLF